MCDSKDDAKLNDSDLTFVIRENMRLKHRCPLHISSCLRKKENGKITHIGKFCGLYEPRHEKTCYAICEQQRRRSACASVQSD